MLKIRQIRENDKHLIEKWLAVDPEHSKTSDVSFWLPPPDKHKGTDYLAVEDSVGVVGYIVLENILRIHCQFAPPYEINRIRDAMEEFMVRIKKEASPQYKQIIFESVSAPLVWFLRRFGFRKSKNEIVCQLGAK